jgi:hypothetical protein
LNHVLSRMTSHVLVIEQYTSHMYDELS